MMPRDLDSRVRLAAFTFLEAETHPVADKVLPHALLAKGFMFDGQRVPLVSFQGIFKPAILPEMPLTIRTKYVADGVAARNGTRCFGMRASRERNQQCGAAVYQSPSAARIRARSFGPNTDGAAHSREVAGRPE